MEEPLAAQLEWWGNSDLCMRFGVLVTVEEGGAELSARGELAGVDLADLEAVEEWELLCEASPYFRLAFTDGSAFDVVVQRTGGGGSFRLTEYPQGALPGGNRMLDLAGISNSKVRASVGRATILAPLHRIEENPAHGFHNPTPSL